MNKLPLLFCLLVLLVGCLEENPSTVMSGVEIEKNFYEGFVEVPAAGSVVSMGTNDTLASADERPQMNVVISYNYFIGKHEVTCSEFNSLMKKASGLQVECLLANLPATNLTYYDAVLYANALSKSEGRDTVYTYVSAAFDNEKNCINLEGFAFHPEKLGYRLPTEAEWIFVAQHNWNLQSEWFGWNSGGVVHPVCSFENPEGVCDILGNVKEWVNDWFGRFGNTSVENFVGSSDGGQLGKRILKGGYFNGDPANVTLYGRGDVYTVTSSTKGAYVGFRLAMGAIDDAHWMNANGSLESSPVVPLVSASTIHSMTSSPKAKLAFRNDVTGNIAFVDLSVATLSVVEIVDSIDAYHPEISPDGNKVAFCTGLEGVPGPSSVYVRNLDSAGSDLVRLEVENAAIPRWRVLGNGDTVIVYVSDAGVNNDDMTFLQKSTWQVKFSQGSFGVPEKLFDGAYHGGISEDGTLAVTGARLLRAKIADFGTTLSDMSPNLLWYGGEQACNASLVKDNTKRTAFLDFAGATGTAFVGHAYRAHEQLFIADSMGNLIKSVTSPSGYTFDHTEWVSGYVANKSRRQNDLVVATLTNANGAHTKIVLANVNDGRVTELLEGEELWHPCMWVRSGLSNKENVQINYDSAGVYYVEGATDRSYALRYRMETFWKYRDSTELIALGSSRTSNGFDPSVITTVKNPLNLAFLPSVFNDIYLFYKLYLRGNVKNLKYLVISLDIDFWYRSFQDAFFYSEYLNYPGYVYDLNHNAWRNADCSLISEATNDGPGFPVYKKIFGDNKNSVFQEVKGWGSENPEVFTDSNWLDIFTVPFDSTYGRFLDLLKMTEEDGITLIGVIFPQSPHYRNTGALGRYGLRRSQAVELIAQLSELSTVYPHFILMDENKMGNHDYLDSKMAQDFDHLAPMGARHFSQRLDSLLATLKLPEI